MSSLFAFHLFGYNLALFLPFLVLFCLRMGKKVYICTTIPLK